MNHPLLFYIHLHYWLLISCSVCLKALCQFVNAKLSLINQSSSKAYSTNSFMSWWLFTLPSILGEISINHHSSNKNDLTCQWMLLTSRIFWWWFLRENRFSILLHKSVTKLIILVLASIVLQLWPTIHKSTSLNICHWTMFSWTLYKAP